MITAFEFQNWKSYSDSKLHVDPLTVLTGTNASGKSNALDALLFLNRIAHGAQLTAALQGDAALGAVRGGVEWAARRPGDGFSLQVTVRADAATDYVYRIAARIDTRVRPHRCELAGERLIRVRYRLARDDSRGESESSIPLFWTETCEDGAASIVTNLHESVQSEVPQMLEMERSDVSKPNGLSYRVLFSTVPGTVRAMSRSSAILHQLTGQSIHEAVQEGVSAVVQALQGIFILDPIPAHMRGYEPLAEQLEPDARNIAGVLAALPEPRRQVIEDTLTRYLNQLPERDIRRVYAETVGKFGADAMLYCDEQWQAGSEPTVVDARGMSDGSLRLLAILVALLTRPEGSLLVVEEVGNGLHPSRAQLLLGMLREEAARRRVDVIVTTHNPTLLDAMGTEMVPFITVAHRDPATGSSELTLLEDLDDLPKLLAQGTVGRLSSRGLIEASLQAGDRAAPLH